MPPRPRLGQYAGLFWEGFVDLHDARPIGMTAGAIPPTEVAAWLDLHGIKDPSVRQDFAAVVRLTDRAFLSQREDWAKGEEESQEPDEEAKRAPKRRTRKGNK